jgi:hypothetical protein
MRVSGGTFHFDILDAGLCDGNCLAVFAHPFNMEFDCFRDQSSRLFFSLADRYATGQIGHICAEIFLAFLDITAYRIWL